jgi:hypothetical protein
MSAGSEEGRTITFNVLDTPMVVQSSVLFNLAGLCAILTWLTGRWRPSRPLWVRLLISILGLVALLWADLGHALAHTLSARWAGAPTDEIQVSAGMPRTVYLDNDVSPRVHRLRALGGPLFSAVGLSMALLQRALSHPGTAARELADWSCLGHGFILGGSLMPLPIVDGGSMLKWTLVERGHSPVEADAVLQQASLGVGATSAAIGLLMGSKRRWLPAAALTWAGLAGIVSGLSRSRRAD